MAKYKIKVIELLLLNNTIAKYGEIVEDNVLATNAETLEKGGYISKATKSDIEKAKKSKNNLVKEDDSEKESETEKQDNSENEENNEKE